MNAQSKPLTPISRAAPSPAKAAPPTIDNAAIIRQAAQPLRDVRFTEQAYAAVALKTAMFEQQHADRACRKLVPGMGRVITTTALNLVETEFREVLNRLPALPDLASAERRINAALQEPATEAHFALCAGIMSDVFPGKSGEGAAVYADLMACVFEFLPETDDGTKVREMPFCAVAAALLDLCTTKTFRPTIAEVIEKARSQRDRLLRAQRCIVIVRNAINFTTEWLGSIEEKRAQAVDVLDSDREARA
ncbi:MAG: hypothetical protein Q8M31_08780 [Beijerinckiaceae bacterium]|nr:hypothetical protein [Beijerinckiaceae bacterium]